MQALHPVQVQVRVPDLALDPQLEALAAALAAWAADLTPVLAALVVVVPWVLVWVVTAALWAWVVHQAHWEVQVQVLAGQVWADPVACCPAVRHSLVQWVHLLVLVLC